MSRDGRKPWETPIAYNDDRFVEPKSEPSQAEAASVSRGASDNGEEREADEVEEILRRPDRTGERTYECNDTTPVNYNKGPHDEEFGVEEHDFDEPDAVPINYEQGPHDEEFGVEDDDEEGSDEDFEPWDEPDDIPE